VLTEGSAEAFEGADVGGARVQRGELDAEERQAPRTTAWAVGSALAEQGVAGRADQYRQSASVDIRPRARPKTNS
jgi:hypothetical protein